MDSNRIWNSILTSIKDEVKPAVFDRWLSPIKLKLMSNGSFIIGVPDIFYKHWISEHYQKKIESLLQKELGRSSKLVIEVNDGENNAGRRNSGRLEPKAPSRSASYKSSGNRKKAEFSQKYTFDNFVEGASNRFARAGCIAVARTPAKAYNPLFIYGGVGLGKTHLMQAIGQYIMTNGSGKKVHYIASEKFTRQMISSLEKRNIENFRRRYRTIDCLLIDDIQFLSGKERTQEEFFHTFNSLFEYNSQIVVSSDRPPKKLKKMEERLTSRFQWGLVVDLQPPDFETRVAILLKNAAYLKSSSNNGHYKNIELPENVAYFIARKVKSNIRQLEGALIKVLSYAAMLSVPLTVALAERVLQDMITDEELSALPLDEVQKRVAEFFDIRVADMKSNKKPKNIARPRQVAMYLARELTDLSLQDIGDAFGGKDHSTIIYGHKVIKGRMSSDPKLRQNILKIMKTLNREMEPQCIAV